MTQGFLFQECQHTRWTIEPEKRGPHHAKKVCASCKKFLGWMPKPETLARQKKNAEILTALSKLPNLGAWERNFVRDLTSHKHISPRQQTKLLELRDLLLGEPPK